jgi:hypothetical protein
MPDMSLIHWPEAPPVEEIADAPRYAPYAAGRYDVRAGLAALGTDHGNGAADGQLFQIDASFPAYRANTLAARSERLGKFYAHTDAFGGVTGAVTRTIARRLAAEHATHFDLTETADGTTLRCGLTGETLRFDGAWALVDATPSPAPAPPYIDAFDALISQVAEDAAVVVRSANGTDTTAAIHLCAANHWSAEDRVGESFAHIHGVVPGMQPVTAKSAQMVAAMIERGPFVRFVWGVSSDTRLNHHPEPPVGVDPAAWAGRRFDLADPRLFVRIERQVLFGLPEVDAALFLIRPSFRDGAVLRADAEMNAALRAGLASMTPEQARYKGVEQSRAAILDWLASA